MEERTPPGIYESAPKRTQQGQQGGLQPGFLSSTCRLSCVRIVVLLGPFLPMPSGIDTGQWSIEACIEKAIVHARLHAHSLLHIGELGAHKNKQMVLAMSLLVP